MNIVLTINDREQAMIMHDQPLNFMPAWVEFSRDKRGVRIVSETGQEFNAGVLVNLVAWDQLDNISDVLLAHVENHKFVNGYIIPFINQNYNEAQSA